MSASLFFLPFPTAFNSNGLPEAGAKLYFYNTGTTTPITVYSNSALTIPASNPVVANGAGRFAQTYLNNSMICRIVIKDSHDNLLDDIDPYIPGTTFPDFVIGIGSIATIGSRTAMAAISPVSNNQRVYLSEAGKQGWFQFSSANLSTSVAADLYQGLYIAPNSDSTGTSGAWVREVTDNTYHTEWWGMQAAGNNGHLAFTSALALMPAGARLFVDVGDTTFGSTVRILKSINIDGYGYKSRIKWNTGASPTHVIIVSASNCKIRNIRVSGSPTGYGAGNPSCIIVTGKDTNLSVLTPVDDVEISGCTLDNCSLPLCFFGDSLNGSGSGGTVSPVTRARAHHNIFKTNVQGVSLFGCDDCEIDNNVIEFDSSILAAPGTPNTAVFRILGSRRFKVHDNQCLGAGETTANGGNIGFEMSAASFGAGQPRRQNQDGEIYNNTIRDVASPVVVFESTGTLTFRGNKFYGDPTSTRQSLAIQVASGGTADSVLVICERLHFIDNLFRGYASGADINPYSSGGQQIKHVIMTGNTFIGNMNASAFPSTFSLSAQFGGILLMNCSGNRFLSRQAGMTNGNITFANTIAGETLIFMDNMMPERASGNRPNGIGGYGGSGTLIFARGGETLATTYGSNMIYPDGTFVLSA